MFTPSRDVTFPSTVIFLAAYCASSLFNGLCSPISRYVLPSSAFKPTGSPLGDALLCAIGVFLSGRIVIDVAGHIDDLAAHFLCFTRREFILLAVLMAFMSNDWRCREQRCGCECNNVV